MHRSRFAGEDQKDRLEGILRIVDISQNSPANLEHERAVPVYQRGEGLLVSM
jgi:hypothetical protein